MKTALVPFSKPRKPADLFVIGIFEGEKSFSFIQKHCKETARALKRAAARGRFTGKFGQTFSYYYDTDSNTKELLAIGLGKKKNFCPRCVAKAVGQVVQTAKKCNSNLIRLWTDSLVGGSVKLADAVAGATEVSLLADYTFDKYKKQSGKKKEPTLELMVKTGAEAKRHEKTMKDARAIAYGTMLARDLINEPANVNNSHYMVRIARAIAAKKKVTVKVFGEAEIKRMKMGGILAVNAGAVTPPALVIFEYGQRYKSKGTICLVGKGVTFDTGGISIKPSRDMEKMKYDMSGSASVYGAMSAIADVAPKQHVVGLTPIVENNVAEDPTRPGDIIKMFNGKTVEVINTDAEGRLILADAIAYSAKYKPKAIIDLATLTGMCVYTFGDKCIGLMTNNEKLKNKVIKAGEEVGERCWELPMYSEYSEQLRGYHSDLLNVGGPHGGTITAAKFLEEFVPEKTPWVHLDIAGVAWTGGRFDGPKGGTGAGVRLLTRFVQSFK